MTGREIYLKTGGIRITSDAALAVELLSIRVTALNSWHGFAMVYNISSGLVFCSNVEPHVWSALVALSACLKRARGRVVVVVG